MMVGVILVGHGKLASELLAVCEIVLGKMEGVEAVDLEMSEGTEDLDKKIRAAYERREEGAGVIALVDIKGGTPGNVSSLLCEELNLKVISGMNLPMLIRALTYRQEPIEQLAERVISGGVDGIEELSI
jgi:PTS system mannose-specific IIA component